MMEIQRITGDGLCASSHSLPLLHACRAYATLSMDAPRSSTEGGQLDQMDLASFLPGRGLPDAVVYLPFLSGPAHL